MMGLRSCSTGSLGSLVSLTNDGFAMFGKVGFTA